MARSVGILMLAGLFAALACARKPADWSLEKVSSANARRDAGRAAPTSSDDSRETSEWIEKMLEPQPTEQSSAEVTPDDLRRDVGRAVKKAAEFLRQAKSRQERLKEMEPQAADRTPGNVASEGVRRAAGQAVKGASAYSDESKREFQKKFEAQLDEMDGKITLLRARGRDLEDGAKDAWEQTMADLDIKRDAARSSLAEFQRASEDGLHDAQYKAESAWDDLDRAYRDASQE